MPYTEENVNCVISVFRELGCSKLADELENDNDPVLYMYIVRYVLAYHGIELKGYKKIL